jgi:asparagine synthase (glutamine-hydrolysing)
MCGLTGFLVPSTQDAGPLADTVQRMAATLRHRGPDDSGVWVDVAAGVALAHRRLSIVDLSPQGHQPMVSACGRYVITFNGEIYNYAAIRRELEQRGSAPSWRGHSDTEVMLAAFSSWGIGDAINRFNGMFAFALWDREERVLHLARDRLGEKPLYYGWMGGVFVFGSELKALRSHPYWRGHIDRRALALFLRHSYIPAPYTIYEGVQKLPPASWLSLPLAGASPERARINPYWSVRAAAEAGIASPLPEDDGAVMDEADSLLRDAVKMRMQADVPLGAFLSGGIDSSAVVALMQTQSSRPVNTFSIGFHEQVYNEAHHAAAVARHLGTEHTELYVTPEQAMAVIPRLPSLYDEPFSDSSQIPTFLVSELARRHVTVSLSGDGGDELFCGYNRYFLGRRFWSSIERKPRWLRRLIARGLAAFPPSLWSRIYHFAEPVIPRSLHMHNPGDKLHLIAEILSLDTPEALYHNLVSHWKNPSDLVIDGTEAQTALTDRDSWARLPEFTQRMMYLDAVSYLPDDILVKVDRASMGVSLEARVPLLDHRVVEFAWRVPLSMKLRGGEGKWLLRQVLYKYVPKALFDRPKMGFGVPIDHWLRGQLRDWAEQLLDPQRMRQEGYLRPEPIRAKWEEHLSGRRNWQYYLWDVLMFQAWLGENKFSQVSRN